MKKNFNGLIIFMKSIGASKLYTDMTMSARFIDWWDEDFYVLIGEEKRKITLPKQFIQLIDDLIKKYSEEIWEGSENEWRSEYYRVYVTVITSQKIIVITSDIEEEQSEGETTDEEVNDVPAVQTFFDDNNINELEVTYSGGGDDGYLADATDDKGNQYDLSNDMENFLYSKLNNSFGGWEIDQGSAGRFVINREFMEIQHEWYKTEYVNSDLRIVITEKDLD